MDTIAIDTFAIDTVAMDTNGLKMLYSSVPLKHGSAQQDIERPLQWLSQNMDHTLSSKKGELWGVYCQHF